MPRLGAWFERTVALKPLAEDRESVPNRHPAAGALGGMFRHLAFALVQICEPAFRAENTHASSERRMNLPRMRIRANKAVLAFTK